MENNEWSIEVSRELERIFNICRCQKCAKELTSCPALSLLEHGYKHIHHFCSYPCLAEWSSKYGKQPIQTTGSGKE